MQMNWSDYFKQRLLFGTPTKCSSTIKSRKATRSLTRIVKKTLFIMYGFFKLLGHLLDKFGAFLIYAL